jgi:hypothetical protein
MNIRLSATIFLSALTGTVLAQPPMAPRDTANAVVNGKKVSISYGRPALKGRNIDDLLKQLPKDRMWRIGANQVTTLTTETDLVVRGKKIPAGKYSLYVHAPETGEWRLAINSDPGIELIKIYPKAPPAVAHELWPRLDGYDKNIADKEVARIALKQGTVSSPVDLFTMALTPAKDGVVLTMSWGDRSWSADLKVK